MKISSAYNSIYLFSITDAKRSVYRLGKSSVTDVNSHLLISVNLSKKNKMLVGVMTSLPSTSGKHKSKLDIYVSRQLGAQLSITCLEALLLQFSQPLLHR